MILIEDNYKIKKISELNGDETVTLLAKILIPIANITEDENIINRFITIYKLDQEAKAKEEEAKEEEANNNDFLKKMSNIILRLIPDIILYHKNDVFEIIGAFINKNAEEVKKQNGMILMKQIIQLMKDEDLIELFMSAKQLEKTS